MPTLLCPVRGCRGPLERCERTLRCPRGHAFDVARSGYLNLLQPQDRRSLHPGDSKQAAAARRRLFDAGHGTPLIRTIGETIAALGLPPRPAVLDVGCGEGSVLGALAAEHGIAAHGVDLSVPAIDLAARRFPDAVWVVANADRFLPWADDGFDLVLSITARLNPGEMRRVLGPGGRLLVAVPGADDLVELREAVLGRPVLRDRLERAVGELAGAFELEATAAVRWRERLDAAQVRDLLAATYRGARASQRPRAEALGGIEVAMSRDLAWLRPR